MSYSEGELAVVDNGRNGLLGYELASGCNAEDDIFSTVLEDVSLIVKTFESNDSNSSESNREKELNRIQLLDHFEDSYFSLVNDKINRLEGRKIEKPLGEKNRASDKDSSTMASILGDVWIAEFVVPADLALFKKILTNAIYTMFPNLKPFVVKNTQPSALEGPKNGKNSRKRMDSVDKTIAHTTNDSKPVEIDVDDPKATEEPESIDKPDVINSPSIPVEEKTGHTDGPKKSKSKARKGRPRSVKAISLDEEVVVEPEAEAVSSHVEEENEELVENLNVEQVEQGDDECEEHESEEDFEDDEENELPKRTYRRSDRSESPVDHGNIDYLKTENFAQLLANCPFFSGHKVSNAQIASRKAAFIIDKLTKDAEVWKSKSSGDETEVSDSGYLSTEAIQRATESYELMELNGRRPVVPDTVRRRTKRRYRRVYTSIPRYLKRSKHKARHVFLQKLNALVDRITTRYINRKKNEIVCDDLYQTIPDPAEYVTGTHGWNHDPYRSNRQGLTKGHGLYLSCGDASTPRGLEHSLNDPFNIPWVSTDRIGHREIVKRMFQEY